jgi:YD repeat-containing protein
MLGYDTMGRVKSSSQQITGGQTYTFSNYDYNVGGGLKSISYPSGRVVSYVYGVAGRIGAVNGLINGVSNNYAAGIEYGPHGALRQMTMVGAANLVEQTCFNNRLQPIAIQVGTSGVSHNTCPAPAGQKLRLEYGYGPATANNGNVQSQGINRSGAVWTQTYTYDRMNRLKTAAEGGAGSWAEPHGYDPWGNHWFPATGRSGLPTQTLETPVAESWFGANNRINGWGYDAAGNILTIAGMSKSFTYDAENRQVTATINGQGTTYDYDGDGRRVRKVSPAGTTIYVYDAAGQLAAEYGTESISGVRYLTADHLGSTRMTLKSDGTVDKEYDYLPFGEDLRAGTAARGATFPPAIPASPGVATKIRTDPDFAKVMLVGLPEDSYPMDLATPFGSVILESFPSESYSTVKERVPCVMPVSRSFVSYEYVTVAWPATVIVSLRPSES